jgi:amino acid permease
MDRIRDSSSDTPGLASHDIEKSDDYPHNVNDHGHESKSVVTTGEGNVLHQKLKSRHMQMIAIGKSSLVYQTSIGHATDSLCQVVQ